MACAQRLAARWLFASFRRPSVRADAPAGDLEMSRAGVADFINGSLDGQHVFDSGMASFGG
jgi:hypothetical protein